MTDWDSDRWPEAFIVVTIVLADLVGVYALVDRLTDGGFL